MRFTSEQRLDDGVLERKFTLGEVPGVLWTPESAPAPLILSGHNGGLHKRLPRLVARARHYAAEYGFAVAAIDAPGHGDRCYSSGGRARERGGGTRERIDMGASLWGHGWAIGRPGSPFKSTPERHGHAIHF